MIESSTSGYLFLVLMFQANGEWNNVRLIATKEAFENECAYHNEPNISETYAIIIVDLWAGPRHGPWCIISLSPTYYREVLAAAELTRLILTARSVLIDVPEAILLDRAQIWPNNGTHKSTSKYEVVHVPLPMNFTISEEVSYTNLVIRIHLCDIRSLCETYYDD